MIKVPKINNVTLSHKNLKRKISFGVKILITVFMMAIFVVPFSLNIKTNDSGHLEINTKINKTLAISVEDLFGATSGTNFKIDKTQVNSNSAIIDGSLIVSNIDSCKDSCRDAKADGTIIMYDHINGPATNRGAGILFIIEQNSTIIAQKTWTEDIPAGGIGRIFLTNKYQNDIVSLNTLDIAGILKPETNYTFHIKVLANSSWSNWESPKIPFKTTVYNKDDPTQSKLVLENAAVGSGEGNPSFDCGITNIPGCVAQVFYSLAEAATWLPRIAGGFLDFFIYYATNSSSYSNQFVEQGWAAVRDIANIFFIIALIFIAIKTILSLNVTDNKKLVGTVIIIALIINFSLFTTKVVIDASNILAKIFYNNITSKDDKGATLNGTSGQKTLSVGIANKFNPQGLAMAVYPLGLGYFIFMTLLLMAVSIYTAYIFFSVALLFVARVISLWISMIFSPLAFASYTVPFDIPGFGHKEWWDTLLKTAFMAPLFVFMLYLIILFAGFLSKVVSYADNPDLTTSENIMQHLMSILIPFIIIAVLLTKSKKLAVEYSGEMGKAVMKGAQMVGGLALGAATGGAALAAKGTIGKYNQNLANNEELKKKAAGGDKAAQKRLDRANYLAKSSFDVRQTGIGKGFSKMSGMDMSKGLGIAATSTENLKGGAKATFDRKVEKEEARVKSYEMSPSAAKAQDALAVDKKAPKNIRATQYEKDKEEAKNKETTAWKKEYEDKVIENKWSANPIDEKVFRENYEKNNPIPESLFNEEDFKSDYEKGGSLKEKYGLDKTVEAGSVEGEKTSVEINKDRRKAYVYSLEHPDVKRDEKGNVVRNEKGEVEKKDLKEALKDFGKSFKEGMKDMTTKPGGLTTIALAGAATGGIGAALALPIGGLVYAIKDLVKTQIPVNKDLAARIAKGENKKEKALKDITAAFGGDIGLAATATKEAAAKTPPKQAETTPPKTSSEGGTNKNN